MIPATFVYLLALVDMSYYHREDHGYFDVLITSYQPTNVSVYIPWTDVITLSMDAETSRLTYSLTRDQLRLGVERGVRVETSSQVTIQVVIGKKQFTNQAAYLALHLTPDSTRYFLASYTSSLSSYKQIYSVMSYQQPADVTVYKHSGGKRSLVTSFTVEPYRVRHVSVSDPEVDITGFYLESTAPVAVFSGHQCVNVPVSARYCDPAFQQLLPLTDFGTDYVIAPIRGRSPAVGYTARIVKTTADTDVTVEHPIRENLLSITHHGSGICPESRPSRSAASVLSADCSTAPEIGDFIELRSTDASIAMSVSCSRPCLVIQYNHGGDVDRSHSDPFMMLLLPFRTGSDVIRFTTFPLISRGRQYEQDNHVNIITMSSGSEALRLDGRPIETAQTIQVGSRLGNLTVTSIKIEPGDHVIEHAHYSVPFSVQLYSHGGPGGFDGKSASAMPLDRALWRNITISRTVPVTQTLSTSTVSATSREQITGQTGMSSAKSVTAVPGKRRPISRTGLKSETADSEHTTFPSSSMTSRRSDRDSWDAVDSSSKSHYVTASAIFRTTMTSTEDPETSASGMSTVLWIMIAVIIILSLLFLAAIIALVIVLIKSKKKSSALVAGVYYTNMKEEQSSNYYTELPDTRLPSDYKNSLVVNNCEAGKLNEACDVK